MDKYPINARTEIIEGVEEGGKFWKHQQDLSKKRSGEVLMPKWIS